MGRLPGQTTPASGCLGVRGRYPFCIAFGVHSCHFALMVASTRGGISRYIRKERTISLTAACGNTGGILMFSLRPLRSLELELLSIGGGYGMTVWRFWGGRVIYPFFTISHGPGFQTITSIPLVAEQRVIVWKPTILEPDHLRTSAVSSQI